MKTLGYFRVNVETAVQDDPLSLVEQEKLFFRFCEKQGYQPMATFVDVESDERGKQPEFQRMLDYIHGKESGFVMVVVKNLDILGSNPEEYARHILELDRLGAKVLCIDEEVPNPLDTAVKEWSRRHPRGEVGERIRRAMSSKAMRGEGLGRPPYGYRIGKDRRFEIVPQEATTVELIYDLYARQNLGIRLVARYLNERGMKTRRGGNWSMISIRDILRNRTYLGTYYRFGMKVPGNHPPIISSEIFQKAQERIGERRPTVEYRRRTPFLLSGLAYCGYCGNKMIGVSRRQKWTRQRDGGETEAQYRYYQCESRTNQSICQYHTQRTDELEQTVLSQLQTYAVQGELGGLEPQSQPGEQDSSSEMARMRAKLKGLKRKFKQHMDQAAKGAISLQQLRTLDAQLAEEQRESEGRLELMELRDKERAGIIDRKKQLWTTLREIDQQWDSISFPEKKLLLQEVVDRIVVYDDRTETLLKA